MKRLALISIAFVLGFWIIWHVIYYAVVGYIVINWVLFEGILKLVKS